MELILGVFVSLVVQWLKTKYKTEEYKTLGILALVCIGAATGHYFLASTGYWESVVAILMTASTFYTLVLARFEASK